MMAVMTDFATILDTPGVEEVSELRGRVGFMAYHGGHLEWMTDVIAHRAAERSERLVLRRDPTRGDEGALPVDHGRPRRTPSALADFLDHVDIVITVHGFGRRGMFGSLLLGGQNRVFAEHVGTALRGHLPAYDVITDVDAIPKQLRGMHERNPVNVPRQQGVQIELPPRVRGASSPLWWDWEGPGLTPHTERLIDGLAHAATTWNPDRPASRRALAISSRFGQSGQRGGGSRRCRPALAEADGAGMGRRRCPWRSTVRARRCRYAGRGPRRHA